MVTPLGNSVFFRKTETVSQCNAQGAEPMTVENLVVQFDQEKFEEILSGGGPVHNTQKHRRFSTAIAPRTADQTTVPARDIYKPVPTAPIMERSSPHSLSASAKAKSTKGRHDVVSCKADRFHANLRLLKASRSGRRSRKPLCARLHMKLRFNFISRTKTEAKRS